MGNCCVDAGREFVDPTSTPKNQTKINHNFDMVEFKLSKADEKHKQADKNIPDKLHDEVKSEAVDDTFIHNKPIDRKPSKDKSEPQTRKSSNKTSEPRPIILEKIQENVCNNHEGEEQLKPLDVKSSNPGNKRMNEDSCNEKSLDLTNRDKLNERLHKAKKKREEQRQIQQINFANKVNAIEDLMNNRQKDNTLLVTSVEPNFSQDKIILNKPIKSNKKKMSLATFNLT